MGTRDSAPARPGLSTSKIVFLVVAAAAPMAAMVGVVPLQFALGTGAGTPGAYLLAGLTLLCFSVGYAAMSRRITNTGGFYTFIARGLGRPPAVAGALVAVIAYNAVAVQLVGGFGYFAALAFAVIGHRGAAGFPTISFAPHTVLGDGFGLAMLFAFGAFVGFESAALYGEEARNPRRAIPVATYTALVLITVF